MEADSGSGLRRVGPLYSYCVACHAISGHEVSPDGLIHHDASWYAAGAGRTATLPRFFFKSPMQAFDLTLDKLENHADLGFDDAFYHQLAEDLNGDEMASL